MIAPSVRWGTSSRIRGQLNAASAILASTPTRPGLSSADLVILRTMSKHNRSRARRPIEVGCVAAHSTSPADLPVGQRRRRRPLEDNHVAAHSTSLYISPSVGRDAADERCLPRAIDDEPLPSPLYFDDATDLTLSSPRSAARPRLATFLTWARRRHTLKPTRPWESRAYSRNLMTSKN